MPPDCLSHLGRGLSVFRDKPAGSGKGSWVVMVFPPPLENGPVHLPQRFPHALRQGPPLGTPTSYPVLQDFPCLTCGSLPSKAPRQWSPQGHSSPGSGKKGGAGLGLFPLQLSPYRRSEDGGNCGLLVTIPTDCSSEKAASGIGTNRPVCLGTKLRPQ